MFLDTRWSKFKKYNRSFSKNVSMEPPNQSPIDYRQPNGFIVQEGILHRYIWHFGLPVTRFRMGLDGDLTHYISKLDHYNDGLLGLDPSFHNVYLQVVVQ